MWSNIEHEKPDGKKERRTVDNETGAYIRFVAQRPDQVTVMMIVWGKWVVGFDTIGKMENVGVSGRERVDVSVIAFPAISSERFYEIEANFPSEKKDQERIIELTNDGLKMFGSIYNGHDKPENYYNIHWHI
ncbi:hypothetical protein [Azospirillum himalayense]|uniref:Uncharacterized protein n=1 Tax=Azospirillum himalayense TaxID=654847 RepID=A0ABW0GHM3_9PROT